MAWVSPWAKSGGLGGIANALASAVENANAVRKNLEAQVDAAMGVNDDSSPETVSFNSGAQASASAGETEKPELLIDGKDSDGSVSKLLSNRRSSSDEEVRDSSLPVSADIATNSSLRVRTGGATSVELSGSPGSSREIHSGSGSGDVASATEANSNTSPLPSKEAVASKSGTPENSPALSHGLQAIVVTAPAAAAAAVHIDEPASAAASSASASAALSSQSQSDGRPTVGSANAPVSAPPVSSSGSADSPTSRAAVGSQPPADTATSSSTIVTSASPSPTSTSALPSARTKPQQQTRSSRCTSGTAQQQQEPAAAAASTPSSGESAAAEATSSDATASAAGRPSSTSTSDTVTVGCSPPTSTSDSAARSREATELAVQLDAARADALAAATKAVALGDVLRSREAQLEGLSAQAAKAMDEAAGLRESLAAAEGRIREGERALEAERKKNKALRAETSGASKLSERVSELENEVKERDARIADILAEGEALSKKMGQVDAAMKLTREKLRAAEEDRQDHKEEMEEYEAKTAALKERVRVLEEEASFARRDKDSASDTAVVWERRVTAAEEEAARLRSEAKSLRAAASAASKEAEEQRGLVTQALNDVEASERNAAEAEAGLASARAAEATATRLLGAYEEQVRDLRSQIAVVQAAAGAREDDLRRDLDDMTSKWQRAQSAAEEQGLQALATAYGLNVNFSGGASMAQQHGQAGSGGGGEEEEGVAPRLASQLQLGVGGRGPASPAHQLQFSSRMGDDAGGSNSGGKAPSSSSSSGGSIVSVTEALISQLAHLQGELQQKRDAWAAQRAALQARVAAAEAAAEGADADARRAETTAADASASAAALRTELISLRGVKARTESEAALTASKLRDSEARLGALTAAHDAMQRQHAEASSALGDLRMRLEEQSGARAAASHMVSVLKDQLAGAHEESVSHKREVAALGREIAALKAALAGGSSGDAAAAAARLPFGSASGAASTSSSLSSSAASSSVSSAASWLNSALSGGGSSGASSPGRGGGGGSSGSVPQSALLASLHALEREKELLTEQVVMLTTRLAAMEDAEARLAAAQASVAAGQTKANLLLEMMGERDEEVEDLRGELEEVRETYKIQLEGLMQRAAAAGQLSTQREQQQQHGGSGASSSAAAGGSVAADSQSPARDGAASLK